MLNKKLLVLTSSLLCVFLLGEANAQSSKNIEFSRNVGMTLELKQRCEGKAVPKSITQRLGVKFFAMGITPEEFGAGANQGAAIVARAHPGNKRPSAKMCRDAQEMFEMLMMI